VKNNLNFERNEVVAVPVSQLKSFLDKNKEADVRIKNSKGQLITIQWIDNDGDGNNDELLFMAHIQENPLKIIPLQPMENLRFRK
jgi:hypothetical protein